MSIESRSRQYGKVFDHWQIKEFLGSGSGGKTAVFRLVRSDSNRGVSALKVVNLIEVRGDINNLSEFRRKEYETARDECSRSAEQEVWLMDDLRGNTNIVDYLDHTFVDWSDETGFGRDLLIRMELLKDLRSDLQNGRAFSEKEVLKIGSDICIALIRCHRKNILHRDIKPENIFRNKDGDYKLGDFGVSRVLDACPGAVASTGIGTYEYWPVEQMTGRYDKRVDIYSLGLVLYELCNQNRLPFAASTYVTGKEVSLRLAGTPLPEPIEASPALSEVILKACAFDPEERYQSAEELLRALNRVIRGLQKAIEQKTTQKPIADVQKKTEYTTMPAEALDAEIPTDKYRTMPASADDQKQRTSFSTEPAKKKAYATEPAEKHVPKYVTQTSGTKKKSKIPVIWIAIALMGLCIAIFSVGLLFMNGSDKHNSDEKDTILQSESLPETTTQNTTSPKETVLETDAYETVAEETAVVGTGMQIEDIEVKATTNSDIEVSTVWEKVPVSDGSYNYENVDLIVVITSDSVQCYENPSSDSAQIQRTYFRNAKVRIITKVQNEGEVWGEIAKSYSDETPVGWIPLKHTEPSSLNVREGIVCNTNSGVNIRTGPSASEPSVGKYLPGTVIEILQIISTGNNGTRWCETEHGWVSMDYVTLQ